MRVEGVGLFQIKSLSLKSASLVPHPITGAGICIESVHYNVLIAPRVWGLGWLGEQGATSRRLIIIVITININTVTDGLRTHNIT